MIASLKVLMKKLKHRWEIKKAISHLYLGYTEIIFACAYVFEVCLRCVQWQHCSQHFTAICSCGSLFPSTSLSAICRSTVSYNEIFTIIYVSLNQWKHANLDNLQQNKENVTDLSLVCANNIAKFHWRDSSLIKQHSSKFYEGISWNILNKHQQRTRLQT